RHGRGGNFRESAVDFPSCTLVSLVVQAFLNHEGHEDSQRKPNNYVVMRLLASGRGKDNNGTMATLTVNRNTAQEVSHAVITAAMRVHSELGPGSWRALIQHVCNMNSGRQDSGRTRKSVCRWFTMA